MQRTKVCSKCGTEKGVEEFPKTKGNKDGLKNVCKACVKEYLKVYREENREKIREKNKEYHEANREKKNEYSKEYYDANREKIREQRKEYGKANKDEINEYLKEYREQNREKLSEKQKKYHAANRGKINKRQRERGKENREKLSEYSKEYQATRKKTDPLYAAKYRLRVLISGSFKKKDFRKTSKTFALLGCSAQELLAKWGVDCIPEGYHIDHICPMKQAQNVEEVEKLCHHSNLQLLPADENLLKGTKPTEKGVVLCRELLGREWIG